MNERLTIISLNAERGSLADAFAAYISVQTQTTDVFCFQEVDGRAEGICDELLLGRYRKFRVSKTDGDMHYCLATYVSDRLTVASSKELLTDVPGVGAALLCTLELANGAQLSITSVHGQPYPGDKFDTPARIEQSRILLDEAKQVAGRHVVMGDFNLLPQTQSVGMFATAGYHDLIKEFNIPTTRNEIAWQRHPDNKQLYADYAFVGQSDLLYDFAVDNVTISDHLPLALTLTLPHGDAIADWSQYRRVHTQAVYSDTL